MLELFLKYFLGFSFVVLCQFNYNLNFEVHFSELVNYTCPNYHTYAVGLSPHTCVSYHKNCLGVTQVEVKWFNNTQLLCHPNFQVNLTSNARLHKYFYVDSTKSITISIDQNNQFLYTTDIQLPNCFIVYAWNTTVTKKKSYNCLYYSGISYVGGYLHHYAMLDEFTIIQCPSNCKDCVYSLDQKSYNCTSCYGDNYTTDASKDCSLVCPLYGGLCDEYQIPISCRSGFVYYEYNNTFFCGQCQDEGCLNCSQDESKCTQCEGKLNSDSTFYDNVLLRNSCWQVLNCAEYVPASQIRVDGFGSKNCLQPTLGMSFLQADVNRCINDRTIAIKRNCYYTSTASKCNWDQVCSVCNAGYYLQNNICKTQATCQSYCNTCSIDDPSNCTSCFQAEEASNGKCSCPDKPQIFIINNNCIRCERGPCEICLNTFYECLTCNSEIKFRQLLGNQCICMDGYYDGGDELYVCQNCHPTCLTCDGGQVSNCLKCDQKQHRHLIKGECVCKPGLGENDLTSNDIECQKCHVRCKTCIIANDKFSCTSCISKQFRVLSRNYACECVNTYGDNNGDLDICYNCHFSCDTCIGALQTDCVLCSELSHRELIDSKCICQKGYFEDPYEQTTCLSCHYSCANCLDSQESDQCTECADQRIPYGSGITFSCVCKDSNYFDDYVSRKCQPCHYSCLTCINFGQSYCSTCDTTIRKYLNQNCKCLVGTYDDGKSSCLPCHQTCLTCSGNKITDCLTCNQVNYNRQLKYGSCKCFQGYFELDSQIICQKCSYRCQECQIQKNQCISCAVNSFRELGNNSSCLCPDGFYDFEGSSVCQICHLKCQGCFGSQQNQCFDCKPLANRYFLNNECLCKSHYYEENVEQCSICSSSCYECDKTYDNCTSCNQDQILVGNKCQCPTKLNGLLISTYDLGQFQCYNCHHSCLTCKGSSYKQCTSCYDHEDRYQVGSQCVCISGYFDSGSPQCTKCGYQCLKCISLQNQCLSCQENSQRILNTQSKVCFCNIGYFDDGQNSICQQCDYSCEYCSIKSSHCLSCAINSYRRFNEILFSCDCISGYYDGGDPICLACHYSCQECSSFSNQQCKTCKISILNSKRVFFNQKCICQIGYYDDGYSSNCQPCDLSCDDCEGQSYNCIACSDSTKLKILNEQTKSCICQSNCLEINGSCEKCESSCLTCSGTFDNCSSCYQDRYMFNNQCLCYDGQFDYKGNCLNCEKSCLTCQNFDNFCLTCSPQEHRKLTINHTCDCIEGYFDYLIMKSCEKCNFSCKTCVSNSQNCTSCDDSLNLDVAQNQCVCRIGYYQDPTTKICQKCHISCLTCVQYGKCTSCLEDSRNFDDFYETCDCTEGYFEANLLNCSKCHYSCFTCQNTEDNCLSCHPVVNRQLNRNMCNCKEGFFDAGIEICMPCGLRCQACVDKSTKCILCHEIEQYRILSGNICKCQPGYFENGSDICECSTKCKTCVNSAEYCTSCDMDQKRLDQSVIIHKCPCMQGFYDTDQGMCEKCHIKCEACLNTRYNCLICRSPLQNNRYLLSDQCNCKPGYYDDDQLKCKKCSLQCKTCFGSESNCLQCQNNLRINSPICKCLDGYYEDQFKNCTKCSNKCQTCQTEESNCLSCKTGRINKSCDCQSGYFQADEENCLRCGFQCKECIQSLTNCIICRGNRTKLPFCKCADGYYDDNVNEDCQICDYRCQKCNLEGCQICNGNRILSAQNSCDPPENSNCYDTTPWCSNCEVAVLNIIFSDDLNSIHVEFDFQLKQTQQTQQCSKILFNDTLKKLGVGYSCDIDQSDLSILKISLGQESSIVVGDQIQLVPDQLQHLNCKQKLSTFIFNTVEFPLNFLEPIIQFQVPINQISSCIENNIFSNFTNVDGKRMFAFVNWSYQIVDQENHIALDEFIVFLNQNYFVDLNIPAQTLPENTEITFTIQVKNFLGSTSTTSFNIHTQFDSQPSIELELQSQYFLYQNIYIVFYINAINCHSQGQIYSPFYQINLLETNRSTESAASSKLNYSQQSNQTSYSVLIPKYTLSVNVKYFFNLSVIDINSQKASSIFFSFEITPAELLCLFHNAKYIQYYRQDLDLNIKCKDINTNLDWNEDEELSIEIMCIDLQTSEVCLNQNNQKISIKPNDYHQTVPKNSVRPYSAQSWEIIATKVNLTKTFNQIIIFLEENILPLSIKYDIAYNIRPINNFELLNFTFDIPTGSKQNVVEMQVEIISDYIVLSLIQQKFYEFSMKFQEQIGQQQSTNNNYSFRFSVQYSTDIVPSYFNLPVKLNIPPTCSKVKQAQQNSNSLSQLEVIAICSKASDSPFLYKFGYFLSEEDLQNFLAGNSGLVLGQINYQISPKLITLVPNSFQNQSILYLVSVMDQGGLITNLFGKTKIQNSFNCTLINNENTTNLKPNFIFTQFIQAVGQDGEDCNSLQQNLLLELQRKINFSSSESIIVLQSLKILQKYQSTSETQKRRMLDESYLKLCYDIKNEFIHINQSVKNENNQLDETLQRIEIEVENFKTTVSFLTLQLNSLQLLLREQFLTWDQNLFEKYDYIQTALLNIYLLPDNTLIKISAFSITNEQLYNNCITLINLFSNISTSIEATVMPNGNPLSIIGEMISWKLARYSRESFKSQFGFSTTPEDQIVRYTQKEQIEIKLNPYLFQNLTLQTLQKQYNITQVMIDSGKFIKTQIKNIRQDGNQILQIKFEGIYMLTMGEIPLCQIESSQNLKDYDIICVLMQQDGNISKCNKNIDQQENQTIINCECQELGQIFLAYISSSENEDSTGNILDSFINENLSLSNFDIKSPIFISFIAYVGLVGVISLYLIISQNKKQNAEEKIVKDQEQESNKQQLKCYPGNLVIAKENFKFLHQLTQFCYPTSSLIQKSFQFIDVNTQFSLILALNHLFNFGLGQYQNSTEIVFICVCAVVYRIISKILQGFARINCVLKQLVYVLLGIIFVLSSLAFSLKIHAENGETNYRKLLNDLIGFIVYEVLIEPILLIFIIYTYRLTYKSISFKEFNRLYHLIYYFAYQERLEIVFQEYFII